MLARAPDLESLSLRPGAMRPKRTLGASRDLGETNRPSEIQDGPVPFPDEPVGSGPLDDVPELRISGRNQIASQTEVPLVDARRHSVDHGCGALEGNGESGPSGISPNPWKSQKSLKCVGHFPTPRDLLRQCLQGDCATDETQRSDDGGDRSFPSSREMLRVRPAPKQFIEDPRDGYPTRSLKEHLRNEDAERIVGRSPWELAAMLAPPRQ
jgi:hypothetical protein